MVLFWRALVATGLIGVASAGSYSCDAEYGAHCPEEVPGPGLISCLAGAGDAGKELSADCKGWLDMMSACRSDIDKFCQGNDADAFVCLTQWTKRHDLEDACAKVLPEPPAEKPPRKGKKSKAKAKRKAHEKATKDAEQRAKKEKEQEKKKKKKSKKKKKKKKKVVDDDEDDYGEL
jgi:hypothetical protein